MPNNDNKTVIELRLAGRASQIDFSYEYEVLLYGGEDELYVLAEFGQGVPVEMCRRFAADAARYFGARLDDRTAHVPNCNCNRNRNCKCLEAIVKTM